MLHNICICAVAKENVIFAQNMTLAMNFTICLYVIIFRLKENNI